MKNRVLFRVDGDAQIGLGHLVRCIALAQMLENEFQIIFISKKIPAQIHKELQENNFSTIQIEAETDFFKKIELNDIVVLDGYEFDIAYQQKVKTTGCKLVCIDDMHDQYFVADLIINHAPGVTIADYNALSTTRFALGLDYVLLRPAFLKQAKQPLQPRDKSTVFICFGGADPRNLTKQTLETVISAGNFKNIIVVVGAAYIYEDSISKYIATDTRVHYHKAITQDSMLYLMLQAGLAIVPSSGILFEAMVTGCHIISGHYIDNQNLLYRRLKQAGAFISAGGFHEDKTKNAIEKFLTTTAEPFKLINGTSDKNILYAFKYLSSTLREANDNDSKLIFEWANDSLTRSFAFNSLQIKWEDHQKWFDSKLQSEDSSIYILSLYGIDVGLIRFDINNNVATISYLIDKEYRGQNLGRLIVEKGIDLIRNNKKVNVLKALVKPENAASIKIFKRLGFNQSIENYQNHHNIASFTLTL